MSYYDAQYSGQNYTCQIPVHQPLSCTINPAYDTVYSYLISEPLCNNQCLFQKFIGGKNGRCFIQPAITSQNF
jgi:hypothetical protein